MFIVFNWLVTRSKLDVSLSFVLNLQALSLDHKDGCIDHNQLIFSIKFVLLCSDALNFLVSYYYYSIKLILDANSAGVTDDR